MKNRFKEFKDKVYYYMAVKNYGVKREYLPYMELNEEEFKNKPYMRWILLIKLNWHYRILRKTTYLFSALDKRQEVFYYAQSRKTVDEMFDELQKYDVVSFDIQGVYSAYTV